MYICKKCGKQIKNLRNYYMHIEKCYNGYFVICPICNKKFNNYEKFIFHCKEHIKNNDCICQKCGKKFTNFTFFCKHIKNCNYIKHDSNELYPYKCKYCNKKFETSQKLAGHVSKYHSKNSQLKDFKCPICGKEMHCNKGAFNYHVHMHDNNFKNYQIKHRKALKTTIYVCKKCNKKYVNKKSYEKHIKNCNKKLKIKKLYKCRLCNTYFETKIILHEHEKNHIKNNDCICKKCGKKYNNIKLYKKHIQKCNFIPKNKIIYTCSICNKQYKNKHNYLNHIKSCNSNLLTCDFCNKKFNNLKELKSHYAMHGKNQDYKCPKCNKILTTFKRYQNHIEKCKYIKIEDRIYLCKYCNKQFNDKKQLWGHISSKHIKNHGIKDFKCPICGKEMHCNKGPFNFHIKLHDNNYRREFSMKIKKAQKNFFNDPLKSKHFRKIHSSRMSKNNPSKNLETLKKMKIGHKKYFNNLSNEEYSKIVINYINAPKKGNAVNHSGKYTMTKPEKIINNMNINGIIYNGNKKGALTIRFKNKIYRRSFTPDFICENNLCFIEVFGIYWHPKEDEKKYNEEMSKNGYKILIIWEDKLYKNPEKEKRRILKFLYKNRYI